MMRVALLLGFITVVCSVPGMAQGNPRDFGRAGPAQEMQRYYAQVQKEVYEEVLLRWRAAAGADDLNALARLYSEKASYFPPGSPTIQTRAAIREYFATVLPNLGTLDVGLIDFGTSGDLAYMTVRVGYQAIAADGQTREIMRTDLMVLRRASRGDWQILTHLAREEPFAVSGPR